MSRIKPLWWFVSIYTLILAIFMAYSHLAQDGYYYWQWSHHLALSYYDGPPLIAYTLKLITTLFGHSEFGLYSLNILTIIITSFVVYKIAKTFFGEKVAQVSAMVWLLTPGVIRYGFFETTYDPLLTIFWALAIFSFLRLINKKNIKYYYLAGISIGLLLLSKYTGILLCLSMLLYLIFDKKAQFIFKSPHTYLALLLAVVIFSPVIIWNAQHQWGSFLFQLHNGYKGGNVHFFVRVCHYLFSTLRDYNVAFIVFVYYAVSQAKWIYRDRRFLFIFIPATLTLLFFFVSSFFGEPLNGWNAPYFFTASIFIAYFIVAKEWSKTLKAIFFFLLIISSLFLLIANTFTQFYPKNLAGRSEPLAVKYLVSQLPKNLYQNRLVVSDYYWTTSLLNYFLPGQPDVYSVIPKGNQNYFWWNQYKQTHSLPKTVIYIASPSATPGAIQKEVIIPSQEFKRCWLLKKVTYKQKRVFQKDYFWRFFVYECELREFKF